MDYIELPEKQYRLLEKLAKEHGLTTSEALSRIIRVGAYLDDMYNIISAKIDLSPEDYDAFMIRVKEREAIIWARIDAEKNLATNK